MSVYFEWCWTNGNIYLHAGNRRSKLLVLYYFVIPLWENHCQSMQKFTRTPTTQCHKSQGRRMLVSTRRRAWGQKWLSDALFVRHSWESKLREDWFLELMQYVHAWAIHVCVRHLKNTQSALWCVAMLSKQSIKAIFEILHAVLSTISISSSLLSPKSSPADSLHSTGTPLVSENLLEYNIIMNSPKGRFCTCTSIVHQALPPCHSPTQLRRA